MFIYYKLKLLLLLLDVIYVYININEGLNDIIGKLFKKINENNDVKV